MTSIPPGRGLEFRTLEVRPGQSNVQSDSSKRENILTTDANGHWVLRLTHFKNSRSVGACEVPLPTNPLITGIVDLWVSKYRRLMLAGAKHDCCFVRPSGMAFTNASQWTNTLVGIFQPRLANSARVSVNVLRKSFLTDTWARSTLEERESNASAMRHSITVAQRNYLASTSRDRVETAVARASKVWEATSRSAAPVVRAPSPEPPRKSTRLLELPAGADGANAAPKLCVDVSDGESEETDKSTADDEVGVVDCLLRQRRHCGAEQYLVKWTDGSETWEPEEYVPRVCIREFYTSQLARAGKRRR